MTEKIKLLILTYFSVIRFTKAEMTGFIVGGNFTSIKDYPHSVFIHISPDKVCGGSILNQVIVLTAAHCVRSCKGLSCKITAYTGSGRRYQGFVSNVSKFKMHKKYDERKKTNDIALLRLAKNLKLGEMVKRIIVMRNPPKYKTAKIAGWGRATHADGSGSLVLKHTKQRVLDRRTCLAMVKKLPAGTFCGQGLSYPHRGDSGSALVIIRQTVQIGIVSFKKIRYSNNTEVYTNVSYFYDWIINNARKLSCETKC